MATENFHPTLALPRLYARFLERNKANPELVRTQKGKIETVSEQIRINRENPTPDQEDVETLGFEQFGLLQGRPILWLSQRIHFEGRGQSGTYEAKTSWLYCGEGPMQSIDAVKEHDRTEKLKLGLLTPEETNLGSFASYRVRERNYVYEPGSAYRSIFPCPLMFFLNYADGYNYFSHVDESPPSVRIDATFDSPTHEIEESCLFPREIDAQTWLKIFRAHSVDNIFHDSDMPWMKWFEDIGVKYSVQGPILKGLTS